MKTWPATAREELERALTEHHARLVGTGVDADEVVADLRRHVETEFGRQGGAPVDVEAVRAMLRGLLESEELQGGAKRADDASPGVAPSPVRLRRAVLHWLFLVILPAVTLGFEWITGLCATELFDPIGRLPELFAVAAVPLVFASILLWHNRAAWVARRRLVRAMAALACGVCVTYAIQFAVLTPFAFVAIIFYGLGLLPLAPLFAFIVSLDLLGQLRRMESTYAGSRARPVWPLVFVALLLLVLTGLSGICASLGLRWYASDDASVQARGLALLRSRFVDPNDIDQTWRANGPGSGIDMVMGLVTGESGRVFGAEFDRAQFAATGGARDLADPDLWRRSRGRGRAGVARWSLLGDLALDGSRIDGTVDPDLLYGYAEWTLTLRNDESWPLEGRATIQLPSGGVVSRVTLWIDGEEREAAFAGRSVATKAYESVAIVQRRDPILVTTAGPDRVRLRCFPVPANGRMKFRLGMTFPLQPTPDGARAEFVLPSIIEANFAIASTLKHSIWMSGSSGKDLSGSLEGDTKSLRGPVTNELLGVRPFVVRRDPARTLARARFLEEGMAVEQEVCVVGGVARPLAIVVDGNPRVLRGQRGLLLEGLGVEGGLGVDVWLALDRPVHRHFTTLREVREYLAATIDAGAASVDGGGTVEIPYRGGFDNGEALASALSSLSSDGGTVLWLHGPQVTTAGAGDSVRQVLERGERRVELVEMAVVPGRNDLLEALDGRPEVRHVGGMAIAALRREIERGRGSGGVEVIRTVQAIAPLVQSESAGSSQHLVRLWAATEISRLAASGPGRIADAVALAVRYQLVTPVSGAVVLETKAQYDSHGLTPVDPASVPTVPDVGSVTVLLLAVITLFAAGLVFRRRDDVLGRTR